MMFGINGNKAVKTSAVESVEMFGATIKKMPLGAYLSAMERINGVVGVIISKCFPDKDVIGIMESLIGAKGSELSNIVETLVCNAPRALVTLTAELTGIDEDRLINDDTIGLDGVIKIVKAFLEVNGIKKN